MLFAPVLGQDHGSRVSSDIEREREREREREEWALVSGQIVSGMSLCFSINSITSLTETPNTLGDSKV